ncbi:hypothetical protein MHM95_09945 [Pseudoalteromonas sp. CnMc7-15]|uniref:hypothetical protein n=1 Tax=unclassified Pseudoalteromonas TaxID=194690 RepID=UPI001EF61F15|nr:hypothetical protein [Pseudoalteromonas sp. CnMc7-15]MCG7566612.1 hypothetical protein [Pseudoalteromonas sp. CnMc7-15]
MSAKWKAIALVTLSTTALSAQATTINCSHLEKSSYIDPKAYQPNRIRSPFGSWSTGLVDGIEKRFQECLTEYTKKHGAEGFKTQKLVKQQAYFETVKAEIKANIQVRQFANEYKGKGGKLMDNLERTLNQYGIQYDSGNGFRNKKLPIERDSISSIAATGLGNKQPQALTEGAIEDIREQISQLSEWEKAVTPLTQSGNVDMKDMLTYSDRELLPKTSNVSQQFNSYLKDTRYEPYLAVFNQYATKLNKQINPFIDQHAKGQLDLQTIMQSPNWRAQLPNEFELESILEALMRSGEMLENRGLPAENINQVKAILAEAQSTKTKFLAAHKSIQQAEKENNRQIMRAEERAKENSRQYAVAAQSSEAAQSLRDLGYPDAMFSFGQYGNPIDSTYAVVHCLSSHFGGHEVEKNGKAIEISFGKKGLFSLDTQYVLRLSFVTAYGTQQYVIVDTAEPNNPATQDGMSKIIGLAQRIKSCGSSSGISLIN